MKRATGILLAAIAGLIVAGALVDPHYEYEPIPPRTPAVEAQNEVEEIEAWMRSQPPCTEEDSPGPCFWDAQTRGNKQGRSFFVDAGGTVTYLD